MNKKLANIAIDVLSTLKNTTSSTMLLKSFPGIDSWYVREKGFDIPCVAEESISPCSYVSDVTIEVATTNGALAYTFTDMMLKRSRNSDFNVFHVKSSLDLGHCLLPELDELENTFPELYDNIMAIRDLDVYSNSNDWSPGKIAIVPKASNISISLPGTIDENDVLYANGIIVDFAGFKDDALIRIVEKFERERGGLNLRREDYKTAVEWIVNNEFPITGINYIDNYVVYYLRRAMKEEYNIDYFELFVKALERSDSNYPFNYQLTAMLVKLIYIIVNEPTYYFEELDLSMAVSVEENLHFLPAIIDNIIFNQDINEIREFLYAYSINVSLVKDYKINPAVINELVLKRMKENYEDACDSPGFIYDSRDDDLAWVDLTNC